MANLEFRVLGPFEVRGAEGPIVLSSARQRAILASLVLERGSTVSTERLVDEVWGEHPPLTARHALSVHVGALRRLIGPGVVEAGLGGYQLRSETDAVDLDRFEALADEAEAAFRAGDPATAADRYRLALGLWRGPALANLGSERAAVSARARLDARRTRVTELWLDAELAAGRHADVLPALHHLVAEEPLREAFQTRLMVALYRSGRQAEALAVYHRAREVLDRELGVEPGPELEAAQRAILEHDPDLQLAGDVERPVAPAHRSATNGRSEPAQPTETRRQTRRTVTALFAEVSGPASGESLDPESADRPPASFVEGLRAVVERHGGTVQPSTGDVVLAVFGAPIAHEDDALRAVRAAAEMRAMLPSLAEESGRHPAGSFSAQIGLNSGEILVGQTSGLVSLVAGEVVKTAERLALAGPRGDIVLGESTNQLVRRSAETVPAGLLEGAGRSPVAVYRLAAVDEGTSGHQMRLGSSLVGRQRELGQLEAALEQSVDDETCALFTLLGPAGVGKSRLVHEFLGSVRPDALVLRGRCLPYGEQVGFWPIAEVVKQAAGIADRADPVAARQKIEALLEGHHRGSVVAGHVSAAIGLSAAPSTAEDTAWAIRSLFDHLARTKPLVVVFDDIQWAEPAFLDLVESIAATSRDVPILLLCIARPELLDERPGWGGGKLSSTSMLLRPLNEEEVSQLVANFLGGPSVPPTVQRKLADAAEGNPLFVEEFLAILIDDGLVERRGDAWFLTTDLDAVAIPGSIQALLTARLDRLPGPERDLIERASIVGKTFSRLSIEAMAPGLSPTELDSALGSLVRRELIRQDRAGAGVAETYRFKHILIRDAAYAGLPKSERILLHERLANWLADASSNSPGFDDELIGGHLERAYRYRSELGPLNDEVRKIGREAAVRLARAGQQAMVRGMTAVSEGLLLRAVVLLSSHDPARLSLLLHLTQVQIERGELNAARETNEDLMRAAVAGGHDDLRWRALIDQMRLDWVRSNGLVVSIEVAMEAISFFESHGDDEALGLAWRLVAAVDLTLGQVAKSRLAYLRSAEAASRAHDMHGQSDALNNLASIDMLGPSTVSMAIQTATELLAWARATGQLTSEAVALAHLGRLQAMLGDFESARRLVASAIDINRDIGAWHEAHSVSRWIGTVEWLAGDPMAAERALRRGYEALRQLGAGASVVDFVGCQLGRMLYLVGRYDEAYELTTIAEGHGGLREIATSVDWRSIRGLILARRNETDAGLALAREAVAIVETSDLLWAHGVALEDLSEVLELAGRPEEARIYLGRAFLLYEEKGITVLADRARKRLDA